MLTTRIKLGIVALVSLAYLLAMPNFVRAEIIASFSDSSATVETGNRASWELLLGTGLTGTPTFIQFHASSTISSSTITTANLISCPDTTLTGCYLAADFLSSSPYTYTGNKTLITVQLENATSSMLASNYYYISLGGPTASKHYGGNSATNPGKYCIAVAASSVNCSSSDATLLRQYFFLGSAPNYQNQGISSIITPTYGQVVSSANNVNFSFSYYINSLAYDKAGFTLVDNTAGQNIAVSSLEEDINASGLSTFSDYFDLIDGHVYSWTPYIRNSTTDAYLYGSTTPFFAGAKTNQSIPVQPTPLWNGCTNILCQGAIFSTSTGILTWNGGTTTSPFGPFGETLDDLLRNKAPFSYLYDIKQVLYELGNGSSASSYTASCHNSDGYYTLPTGSMGTTLSNGSTTVLFIDACAIRSMPVVVEIRKAITYALYLITGIGLASMAMSAI